MPIIDSQVHAYERDHPGRPWQGTLVGPEEVTGDQMVAAMDAVGVDGAILVSPFSMYAYDASYALEVRGSIPAGSALVKPVDPNDPGVAETIANWAAIDGTVGIRIMMRDILDRPGRPRPEPRPVGGGAALDAGQPALCGPAGAGGQLAHRHPNTQFVVDHLGLQQPFEPPPPAEPGPTCRRSWLLRRIPNVAIKISGACTLSQQKFPYADIWDPLGRIFDAFGFDRCLWGTDWTRAVKLLTYKEGVDAFRVTGRLSDSDRAKLMGDSLSRVYNWSPKKS